MDHVVIMQNLFSYIFSAEVTIYLLEHSTLGSMTRVQATLTCMYLENVTRKVSYCTCM